MIRVLKLAVTLAALTLGLAAHAAKDQMQPATSAPPAPTADQAVLELMRPSIFAKGIRCAVFDVTESEPKLLAILNHKMKIALPCAPGKHRFMVTGETADFMEADLVAGKTYYAIVIPRPGAWKARFSLIPLKRKPGEKEFTLNGPKMKEWQSVCKYHVLAPTASQWYQENRPSVLKKQTESTPRWAEMSENLKQYRRLLPEDGE
jgi:hypothetical protein